MKKIIIAFTSVLVLCAGVVMADSWYSATVTGLSAKRAVSSVVFDLSKTSGSKTNIAFSMYSTGQVSIRGAVGDNTGYTNITTFRIVPAATTAMKRVYLDQNSAPGQAGPWRKIYARYTTTGQVAGHVNYIEMFHQ